MSVVIFHTKFLPRSVVRVDCGVRFMTSGPQEDVRTCPPGVPLTQENGTQSRHAPACACGCLTKNRAGKFIHSPTPQPCLGVLGVSKSPIHPPAESVCLCQFPNDVPGAAGSFREALLAPEPHRRHRRNGASPKIPVRSQDCQWKPPGHLCYKALLHHRPTQPPHPGCGSWEVLGAEATLAGSGSGPPGAQQGPPAVRPHSTLKGEGWPLCPGFEQALRTWRVPVVPACFASPRLPFRWLKSTESEEVCVTSLDTPPTSDVVSQLKVQFQI